MFNFKAHLRFTALFFAAFAVIVFSGTGCKPAKEQTGPPEKITIAYSTVQSTVIVQIAFVKGYFKEEGLDATLQPHAFGKQAFQSLIEGKADLATAKDTPFMFAVMDGQKITTLAVIQTSGSNQAIIARRDRSIAKPSDLKGKTIGVKLGTKSEFFSDVFLTVHGIDRKQVTILDMMPDEMAASLSAGGVDAVSTWNPVLTQMQKELGNKGITFYGETLYSEAMCVAAYKDYVRDHPEAIRKFLRALIKAETFIKQHPEESRRLVAEFIKTDKALLDEIWDLNTFRVTLDQVLLINLEDQTRWALKKRLTKRQDMPNYLDFIYVDGLQTVKPQAVRIIR